MAECTLRTKDGSFSSSTHRCGVHVYVLHITVVANGMDSRISLGCLGRLSNIVEKSFYEWLPKKYREARRES